MLSSPPWQPHKGGPNESTTIAACVYRGLAHLVHCHDQRNDAGRASDRWAYATGISDIPTAVDAGSRSGVVLGDVLRPA